MSVCSCLLRNVILSLCRPPTASSRKLSDESTRSSGLAPPPQEDPPLSSAELVVRASPAPLLSLSDNLLLLHPPPPPRSLCSSSCSATSAAQQGAGLNCGSPQSSQSLSGCSPSLELLQSPPNSPASSWGQSQPSLLAGAQLLAPSPPPPRSSNQRPAAASQESRGSRLPLEALSTVYLFSEPPPDDPDRPRRALQASAARLSAVTHNALAEEMEEEGLEDDLSTGE